MNEFNISLDNKYKRQRGGNEMKAKPKKLLFIIIVLIILSISFLLPLIRPSINQSLNKEFIEKVDQDALSANIYIVGLEYRNEGNDSIISVPEGASGVLIGRENNKYYALTARHVLKEPNNDTTRFIVMGHNQPDFKDFLSKEGEYLRINDYYHQFPEAKIEYSNDKYDLAIISFKTNENYKVLPISTEIPKYGDIVAAMGNQNGERNIVTAGKISSRNPSPFGDEEGENQYPIIKHTALISGGSSGSALLNENLEIVGINLGGKENIFHSFISGMAMPSDRISTFMDEWKNQLSH